METLQAASPTALVPGTRVGPWRVVSRCGHGSYGVVYRVERAEPADTRPFALKLALRPLDPRFEREGELLSRIHHPQVPRLQDRGWVKFSGDVLFPYLVMDWVEGPTLYEWASRNGLTSRQALRLLSQVARALEATHAPGVDGVHRDVKGDNVRVRAEDGRAVLLDFGSAHFRGAATLTRQPQPPGTPQYQSPESLHFQWRTLLQPTARYLAGPSDDVYALGMTAYRLVTGRYPPDVVDVKHTQRGSRFVHLPLVPPETWVHLCPELAALIRQMLATEPSARSSAAEVAQALEHAAETAGPEADQPIAPFSAQASTVQRTDHIPSRRTRASAPWLEAVVGVALAISAWWTGDRPPVERREEVTEEARDSDKEDAGTVGLAEVPVSVEQFEPVRRGIGLEMPKNPLPGQRRPPCVKPLIKINGGCWVGPVDEEPPCGARSYEWQNKCYLPLIDSAQPATSDPP